VGGLLVSLGGWRAIFVLSAPLALVALALGARVLPASGAPDALRRAPHVPLTSLFRHRAFAGATGAVALSNFAAYLTLITLPLLFTRREHWNSSTIGIAMAAMSVAMCAASPLGGRLADLAGRRAPATWGLGAACLGLVPLALAPATLPLPLLLTCLMVVGGGVGLSAAALQVSAIESVDARSAGVASGVYSTARYAGAIAGTSLLAGPLALASHGLGGFGLLFSVLTVAAAASVALTFAIPERRPAPRLVRATPSASAAARAASG
jgi:predicted MFS family arabinose efflux permease